MRCYRDTTFCPFWKECQQKPCPEGRELTESMRQVANGKGLLICQFTDKPECFKETKNGQ